MSTETPARILRRDVYNVLKIALEMLSILAKSSPFPQIDGVIFAVKSIMDTVVGVKHNKQACYDVGLKIGKIIDVVHTELKNHDDIDSDRGTKRRVGDLESSLSDISRGLSDLAQENAFRRAFNRVADADLIQDLNKQVDECLHRFMLGTQLSTAIDIKHLRDEAVRMRLTEGVLNTGGWRSDRRCLPGTRTWYIDRIWEWVRSPDGPALCWLNGIAGSGKSAISHELSATLHAKRRPYSCFFFKHDDAALALSAVRLLAYGLSFVSGLRELVVQALEQSDDTRVHPTMEEQFMALIVTPLQEFAAICPETTVVLVIDGVDECPADVRPSFLAALRAGVLHLPASVKIFLASRPRGDVHGVVEALSPLDVHLAVGAGKDDGDVELFLQRELLRICEAGGLERTWPPSQIEKDVIALSAKAGGLFQWAKLATALLGDQTQPREMIARILSVADSSSGDGVNLDALYAEALSIAVPAEAQDKDLRPLYRQVVGMVVAAQEPLTISAICTLLNASGGVGCDASTVRTLLENLGSVIVLRHVRGGAVVVGIGHPSFSEYVTSPQRCPPAWYIDLERASAQLGACCFSLMAKSLKRDICGMHGPSVANKDVSSKTIYQYITTGLRYACGHTFAHISEDKGNWRLLETFLMEKLLEWLEAMSLLGLLDTAVELLRHALVELEQEKSHTSCVEILQDAIRFIGRFGSVINKSAMNIYYSALPFAPQNTTLYRVYAARYRDIPRVTVGYLESWPEELCTVRNLGGDGTSPRRLAFSADSSRLALATSTHLVTASPLTGIQLGGKYRLGSPDAEPPIALACRPAYLASITSGLMLRIVDARSLKEVQLSLPSTTSSSGTLSPEVSCAAFSQNVNTLFVGFRDGRIHVWRLRRYSWEPDKDSHPQSHSSTVHCVAASSESFASVSQRELKIGPFVDSKSAEVARETLTLTPRCLAEVRDSANGDCSVRLSFSSTSATAWACVVSLHHGSLASHSVYLFTSDDQRGKKVFASNSPSYPVYSLSRDASILTVICDDQLLRWSTALHSLLEKRALFAVDRARSDRFPVISPDGHLLALCDEEVVHIRDLMQPPPRRPENNAEIKAAGVILAEECYMVRAGGKEHWLARVRDDGTAEDIVQLGEHEIEHLAVSADGSKLASLSFYQGKTRRGLLEIADLRSKRRATTTTWPVALHDSFTDWDVCHMEFSATRKHVAIVFFLRAVEASYICACDLESGTLRWKQLPGKLRPLAARSLRGEELIVVRTRDLWKVDLEAMASSSSSSSSRHELYSRDAYRMATSYAKFTDRSAPEALLEMASRLWNKPPWYTVWNLETVTREEEAQIKRTAAYLEVHDKNAFGYWVLDNMGQRICCVPEEHCSGWTTTRLRSISRNRFALVNGDTNAMIVVNFKPMMELV